MNIFCQSLGVTTHAKTFLAVCCFQMDLVSVWTARGIRSKKIVIRLNDLGYPFGKSCHPFKKRLGVSVWKKLSSTRTAWATRSNGLGYPFEKIVIHSNGLGYPFQKEFVDCSSDWSYLFKDKLIFSRFPSQNQFVASHSRRTIRYSPGHVR